MKQFESGAEWRATIPFTNEEIAAAFRQIADEAPRAEESWREDRRQIAAYLEAGGLLTKAMLMPVLSRLVKTCAVCGRKAIYRYGTAGRCSKHRDVVPAWEAEERRRFAARSRDIAERRAMRDDRDLRHGSARQTAIF